ncbi:MAG: imidazole glycerol phosphate synthase subunit HisH [Actinomycetota bacterium]|nr:imidazole glycerol phosphate synthase subunit HisH [Actinomycetota bacterium]
MKQRVAIVDYGLCNLDSVRRAFETLGAQAFVTDLPSDLEYADRIVLPGVGAFPDAMRNLRGRGLDDALGMQVLEEGAPFLGVCLGMQLMADLGHEVEDTKGLAWLSSQVTRLVPTATDRRVPHIGWNEVRPARESPLFAGIPPSADFYFVHSFHVACAHDEDVLATTPYCGGFASAVQRDNVFGVQFHPEKSQQYGLRLLKNFLSV